MPQRIVLWVDTSSRVAPKVTNGGASIPTHVNHKPNQQPEDPDKWFAAGWRIVSASSFTPFGAQSTGEREVTVLVLEHDKD